jgi:hypothetical protein
MAIGTKVPTPPNKPGKPNQKDTKPTETKLTTQELTVQNHHKTGTELTCRAGRGLHFERKAVLKQAH